MSLKFSTKSKNISDQFLAIIRTKGKVFLHDYDFHMLARQVWTLEAALSKCLHTYPGDLNRSVETGYNARIASVLQALRRAGKINSKRTPTGHVYFLTKKGKANAPQTP